MKRGYTVEEYREMLARIREWLPEVADQLAGGQNPRPSRRRSQQ